MEKGELPFLSATELSELIRTREVSPVEAAEAYLERIDQLDGKLNSYVTVCREEALEAARDAERAIARGEYLGPMHGIPVAVKDQFYTRGIRTTGGSRIFGDFIPDEDATVMANLKRAGAVLLGKLNMSEFAMGEIFDHAYGTPHNPWDLGRNPGTSSSGSGAATAAFLCATSLGEDTGGSIRGPANWCGLVGLRPTWGRVSRYGVMGGSWSMDTVGPISRTVEDCAMTFQAIAGHDPRDPTTWDVPVPDYLKALDGNMRGIRVGVVGERVGANMAHAEYRDAVAKAVEVLGELGASVEEVSLPLTVHSGAITLGILNVEWASLWRDTFMGRFEELDRNNQIRFLSGCLVPAQAYYKAQKLRTLMRQQVLEAFERVDVLVLPTGSVPAPPIESVPGTHSKEQAAAWIAGRVSFTGSFNLAGVPALSVPCGFTSDGLPVGLQIAAPPFGEETAMRVAHAYEQATPWHTKRPVI